MGDVLLTRALIPMVSEAVKIVGPDWPASHLSFQASGAAT
jgi:hypothetical protein